MALEPNKIFVDDIKRALNEGVKRECGRMFDAFVKDLQSQKESIVAGICLNVSEYISYHDEGHILKIEIKKS